MLLELQLDWGSFFTLDQLILTNTWVHSYINIVAGSNSQPLHVSYTLHFLPQLQLSLVIHCLQVHHHHHSCTLVIHQHHLHIHPHNIKWTNHLHFTHSLFQYFIKLLIQHHHLVFLTNYQPLPFTQHSWHFLSFLVIVFTWQLLLLLLKVGSWLFYTLYCPQLEWFIRIVEEWVIISIWHEGLITIGET